MDAEEGQASIEALAAFCLLCLVGVLGLQAMAAGYALTLADGAAEAGALALADRRPAEPAARAALPGWARDDVRVEVRDGRVVVALAPPTLIAALRQRLELSSSATVAIGGG